MELPEGHLRNPKQSDKMQFSDFIRKPFKIEAVEITTENIQEIAELVGTLKHKPDGTPYIKVNRRWVPNVDWVYPGFWMTRMGDNIRCYSKRAFNEQFVSSSAEIEQWVDFLNDNPVVTTN